MRGGPRGFILFGSMYWIFVDLVGSEIVLCGSSSLTMWFGQTKGSLSRSVLYLSWVRIDLV